MLLELVLPRVAGAAALPPVKGEILELLQSKAPWYAMEAFQQLKHIFAGLELMGQGFAGSRAVGRFLLWRRVRRF